MNQISFISAEDFTHLMSEKEGLKILDIRTDIEVHKIALTYPTHHMALHDIDQNTVATLHSDATEPLYLLCKAGPRAVKMAEYLEHQGFENMCVIDGGIMGCIEHEAPTQSQNPDISMDQIMDAVQASFQKFILKISDTTV